MVVQHNMQAMNTNRQLGLVTGQQAKSTEKLSSGYKINRAADDAAGLAISEKMRSQIRGLDRASTNAQDGISVVQTAEGALNEVHSMLQRMNELATQAANDTNTSQDRNQIKLEINQLSSEIDRVASTTQFNTMNLLDGKFTGKNLQVGALSGQSIGISISSMKSSVLGVKGSTLSVSSFSAAGSTMKKVQSGTLPQQSPVSVIPIWLRKWLTTARTTFLLRQVSLCWLRLTSPLREFFLSSANSGLVRKYTTIRRSAASAAGLFFLGIEWLVKRKENRDELTKK